MIAIAGLNTQSVFVSSTSHTSCIANFDTPVGHMDSVASIISEFVDVQALLRNKNLSEDNKTNVVNQICAKISSLRTFDPAHAAKLLAALDAAQMLEEFHILMAAAINRRMSESGPAKPKGGSTQPQLLSNILHYLTESDWDVISVPN